MSVEVLEERLAKHLEKIRLEVVLNENRSTMLSVLERGRHFAKISIHKMFLKAPDEVLSAVASFVKGKSRRGDLRMRSFIQNNLRHLDYSERVEAHRLTQKGAVYDLQALFDALNTAYFDGKLSTAITWYGTTGRKNRSRVVFGQYLDQLKLIKINRILDDSFFPEFFVRFIIYHEMVHAVVPGFIDERGFFRIHGPEFKRRERAFAEYEEALSWEKENKPHFFLRGCRRGRA